MNFFFFLLKHSICYTFQSENKNEKKKSEIARYEYIRQKGIVYTFWSGVTIFFISHIWIYACAFKARIDKKKWEKITPIDRSVSVSWYAVMHTQIFNRWRSLNRKIAFLLFPSSPSHTTVCFLCDSSRDSEYRQKFHFVFYCQRKNENKVFYIVIHLDCHLIHLFTFEGRRMFWASYSKFLK